MVFGCKKSRRSQRQPHNPQTARSYWPSRHSSTASEKISPHASHSLRSISLASSSASPSVGGVSCSAIHWHSAAAEMIARYKYLSDADKKNTFDVDSYLSSLRRKKRRVVTEDEPFDLYDIELSDEDFAAE